MEHNKRIGQAPQRFDDMETNKILIVQNLETPTENALEEAETIAKLKTHEGIIIADVIELKTDCAPPKTKMRFKCIACKEIFIKCEELAQHAEMHNTAYNKQSLQVYEAGFEAQHSNLSYSCVECEKTFQCTASVRRHFKEVHLSTYTYNCIECGVSYKNKSSYNYHLASHPGFERTFKCDNCAKMFITQYELKEHMKQHTLEKPYKCELCAKTFANRSNWVIHQRLHTAECPYKCQACSARFNSSSNLKRHQEMHLRRAQAEIADSIEQLEQPATNVSEQSSTNITENEISAVAAPVTESLLKPFATNCSATLLDTSQLSERAQVTHVEVLPALNFSIPCEKIAVQQRQTQKPQQEQQSLIKPEITNSTAFMPYYTQTTLKFQCETCQKFFKQKSGLVKHMRIHTGEKPYKCPTCPKAYADASNFKKHKMVHKHAMDEIKVRGTQLPTATLLQQMRSNSPTPSSISDPDPDGMEMALQCERDLELSSTSSSLDENEIACHTSYLLPFLRLNANAGLKMITEDCSTANINGGDDYGNEDDKRLVCSYEATEKTLNDNNAKTYYTFN